MINEYLSDDPKLLDLLGSEFVQIMKSIQWIQKGYGFASKLYKTDDSGNKSRSSFVVPAIFIGGPQKEDYMIMFPSSELGNFSFLVMEDGQSTDQDVFKFTFSVVVNYDFRKIETVGAKKTGENLIADVCNAIKNSLPVNATYEIKNIYRDEKNVFKGFTYNRIETKYLMRPHGSFRIEMSAVGLLNCN